MSPRFSVCNLSLSLIEHESGRCLNGYSREELVRRELSRTFYSTVEPQLKGISSSHLSIMTARE